MMVQACCTSASLSDADPVMLIRMPRAPSIAPASSSGDAIARCAASMVRFVPARRRRAHHRITHARHDRLHVGEVAVDDAGNRDDVGNPLHALPQNVVGNAERFEEARILRHRQQLFIGNHDRRVHRFHQLGDAALGLRHAPLALQTKTAW